MNQVVDQRTLRQLAEAVVDLDADVEEQVLASLEVARLRRRLGMLGRLERQVLCWRYGIAGAERLSHREIACRLAIPVWRVHSLEEQALELLRAEFVDVAA